MNRRATDVQESVPESSSSASPPLPPDHVLYSGAVLFPGAFDQHGRPLMVFPVDGQARLLSEVSSAEVVDFVNYFLYLHKKKQEKERSVSVVADLRQTSLAATRFIAETLLLLEHMQMVHSAYLIQPRKKDALKVLLKLLAQSKYSSSSLKKVFVKDVPELSIHIDRSQLTASLGGYLVYCHQSWVSFIKEIDAFVREFLSVVQRLPHCISSLHALSRRPLPSTYSELRIFCTANEATFLQLRRELGLDQLLCHCEVVLEKLRFPERDPCYQAMAGTALFTHTAFDMLQNHSRITAAVEKVELLWQQAFSKARFQLRRFQLWEEALQITEKIQALHGERLQPYNMEIAKDASRAVKLVTEFESTIHTPAMALVRCAEDVIHTLDEMLPFDGQEPDPRILELERLKEKLHSAVHFVLQTLRTVAKYHHSHKKASRWYSLVLHENFLQDLLSGLRDVDPPQRQRRNWGTMPAWRHKILAFLRRNPPPLMEELVHLAHLANIIPDEQVQKAGKQLSHRCLALRKLLISSGPVAVDELQQALQWQYELLRSSHLSPQPVVNSNERGLRAEPPDCYGVGTNGRLLLATPTSPAALCGPVVEGKPASLSSFDSGFDGAAGSSQVETCGGRGGIVRGGEGGAGAEGLSESVHSLNFEIKVKRSAPLPSNPWLGLPVEDLEDLYTVTVTPSPTLHKRHLHFPDVPEPGEGGCRDQPTQTERSSSLEDTELSSIGKILSSTMDGGDKSLCTTEGLPTMLWDSYDLHEHKQDSVHGLTDVSLKDWDVKEQENLRQVEEILERTDEILGREENVLAQEAVLDALLRSEEQENQWRWGSEGQLGAMSSAELTDAGVLGLDDCLLPSECEGLSDPRPTEPQSFTPPSRPDLLAELKKVQDLDEMIVEESQKIQRFRQEQCRAPEKVEPPDPNTTAWSSDGQPFQLKLEKGKREVEWLEQEQTLRKQKGCSTKKVVRCSIMVKARSESREDEALCNQLLFSCANGLQRTRSTSQDPTDLLEVGKEPDGAKEASEPLDSSVQCEEEPSNFEVTSSLMKIPSDEQDQSQPPGDFNDEYGTISKPEASLTPVMKPDDGAFDPGGHGHHLPPMPKPRKVSLPVNITPEEDETSTVSGARHFKDTGATQSTDDGVVFHSGASESTEAGPTQLTDTKAPEPTDAGAPQCTNAGASWSTDARPSQLTDTEAPELADNEAREHTDAGTPQFMDSGASWSTDDGPSQLSDAEAPELTDNGPPQLTGAPQFTDNGASLFTDAGPSQSSDTVAPEPTDAVAPEPTDAVAPEPTDAVAPEPTDAEAPEPTDRGASWSTDSLDPTESLTLEDPTSIKQSDSPVNENLVLDADVKNLNNNNNHLPQEEVNLLLITVSPTVPSRDVDSDCTSAPLWKRAHPLPAEQNQTLPRADQSLSGPKPLESDCSMRAENSEDFTDGPRGWDVVRMSASKSPSGFGQVNDDIREVTDFRTPIVLDTGSGLMKAGFADQDFPTVTFPTIIGVPKYEEIMNGRLDRETYIGHDAQHMRGVLALRHPIKNGIIRNWDDMEKIWQYTFRQLCVSSDEHPVMLTEAAMNPRENRQRMVEIMFESFNVPFTYVALQAVLALYAAGRTTGVVFDSGDGVSHSVPVYEGYSLTHAVQRFPLAGGDVTMHLKKLLQEQGVCMHTTAEMEIVREMKEKCCRVALDYEAELSGGGGGGAASREIHYSLPDGRIVTLDSERFRAPEILFKPELIGRDHYGMHESLFKSIMSSDIDLRRSFLENIVLSGGNTLLPGLPERLQAEVGSLVPSDSGKVVRVSSPQDRVFSVWRGGAALANLTSVGSSWISQEEYEEQGPQIVFRKCF